MSPELSSPLLLEPLPYSPLISASLHSQYAVGLASVERWIGNDFCSDVRETDYEHVLAMFKISQELKGRPNLANSVNFEDVDHMIYIHDGGEVLVGDLAIGRLDYLQVQKRFKRREKAAVRYLINRIPDPNTKQLLRSYSRRYEAVSPNDNEALVAHFVDKLQAVRFGLVHVFNGNILGEEVGGPVIDRSFNRIVNYFDSLKSNLPLEATTDLRIFIKHELEKVRANGYPRKALEYEVRFGLINHAQFRSA